MCWYYGQPVGVDVFYFVVSWEIQLVHLQLTEDTKFHNMVGGEPIANRAITYPQQHYFYQKTDKKLPALESNLGPHAVNAISRPRREINFYSHVYNLMGLMAYQKTWEIHYCL